MKTATIYLFLFACLLCLSLPHPAFCKDERLEMELIINGKKSKFIVDTGASGFAVARDFVQRNNLKENEKGNAEIKLNYNSQNISGEAWILTLPKPLRGAFNGIIGWASIKSGKFRIDWNKMTIEPTNDLPTDGHWQQIPYSINENVLVIKDKDDSNIVIDSGADNWVCLGKHRWEEYLRRTHRVPQILNAGWSPAADGYFVELHILVDKFSIGGLDFDKISLCKNAMKLFISSGLTHSIGLQAMKQYDWVIDKDRHVLYVKKRRLRKTRYPNGNRLGAVFLPRKTNSDEFYAHVQPNTPASEAGLKNGDQLLSINGKEFKFKERNVEKLQQHPHKGMGDVFSDKTRKILRLAIKRQDQILIFKVKLRDLLVPPSS